MPHHIIDLTESPATAPTHPQPRPSAVRTNASDSKHRPSNGNQSPKNRRDTLETTRRLVSDTIDYSTKARPKSVLKNLMNKQPMATEWIGAELLIAEDRVKPWEAGDDDLGNSDGEILESSEEEEEDEDEDEDESEENESASDSSKDLCPQTNELARIAKCKLCKETFKTTSNKPGDCRWHDGDLEMDYDSDIWVDWDERRLGYMDTKENEIDFPDGFRWTCCNRSGDKKGCQKGRHEAKYNKAVSIKTLVIPKAAAVVWIPTIVTTITKASEGVKRLRSRYAQCVNCKEEFDAVYNDPGDCVWHEGEMEVDWDGDFWADHEEKTHGRVDTEDNRQTYPEGFIWTCCDKNGDEKGCKIGRHKENPAEVKRPRIT